MPFPPEAAKALLAASVEEDGVDSNDSANDSNDSNADSRREKNAARRAERASFVDRAADRVAERAIREFERLAPRRSGARGPAAEFPAPTPAARVEQEGRRRPENEECTGVRRTRGYPRARATRSDAETRCLSSRPRQPPGWPRPVFAARNRNPDRNGNRNARAIVPDLRTKRKVSREARSASRGVPRRNPHRRNPHRRNPHRARSVPRNFPRGRRVRSTPRPLPTLRRTKKAVAAARTSSGRARGAASGASRAATRRRTRTRTSRTTLARRAAHRAVGHVAAEEGPRRAKPTKASGGGGGKRSRFLESDRRTNLRARETTEDGAATCPAGRTHAGENAHAGVSPRANAALIDSRTLRSNDPSACRRRCRSHGAPATTARSRVGDRANPSQKSTTRLVVAPHRHADRVAGASARTSPRSSSGADAHATRRHRGTSGRRVRRMSRSPRIHRSRGRPRRRRAPPPRRGCGAAGDVEVRVLRVGRGRLSRAAGDTRAGPGVAGGRERSYAEGRGEGRSPARAGRARSGQPVLWDAQAHAGADGLLHRGSARRGRAPEGARGRDGRPDAADVGDEERRRTARTAMLIARAASSSSVFNSSRDDG